MEARNAKMLGCSVCVCGQVMCFVSLETWGRMCSLCPRVASETSAALSILSKIIQKKGCCNSLDREGRPGQFL